MRFAASKIPLSIDGPTITGGPRTQVPSAAGLINIAENYTDNRSTAPGFDEIASTAMATRAEERATMLDAASSLAQQKIYDDARIKAAKIKGGAERNAGRKKAQGSTTGSIIGAIGTVAGALLMSDRETKENVQSIEDALTKLRNLQPVTFNYKEEWSEMPERMHHGFIAQEYFTVMPDATYYDLEKDKMCIDTNDLIALLVRAIQQLETKVARLETANLLTGVAS